MEEEEDAIGRSYPRTQLTIVVREMIEEAHWLADRAKLDRQKLTEALGKARQGLAPVYCSLPDCDTYWWVTYGSLAAIEEGGRALCAQCAGEEET